ncbi:MAG: hypothetical protein LBI12_03280 [Treponema sp.]|nr:hypothetical protein [Treponema sp.]
MKLKIKSPEDAAKQTFASFLAFIKLRRKVLSIIAGFLSVSVILYTIYLVRSPVLIVTDFAFIPLYGEARIKEKTIKSSFLLFRRILTVQVADEASDDIIRIAVNDVSSRPFCVIFPLRFARSGKGYHEQNPEVPVIILEGRQKGSALSLIGTNECFIYDTDIYDEFYKAGKIAAALDNGKNGKIAVFLETDIQAQAIDVFLQGLNQLEKPLETHFFNDFSQFSESPAIEDEPFSCVVLAGAGTEYLELNNGVPVIFLTWLDPFLLPSNVVLVIDDSPYTQILQAVRMAGAGVQSGQLKSKFQFFRGIDIDGKTLRKIRKYG